jgi:hypothetical protein
MSVIVYKGQVALMYLLKYLENNLELGMILKKNGCVKGCNLILTSLIISVY